MFSQRKLGFIASFRCTEDCCLLGCDAISFWDVIDVLGTSSRANTVVMLQNKGTDTG
jgi:hypothetical protein